VTTSAPPVACRISPPARIAGELARIGRAEVEFAIARAAEFVTDPAESVHQFRKAIKRLRALLRLGSAADPDAARDIDRTLRDIGRMLSDARDAEVVVRTANKLRGGEAGLLPIDFGFALAEPVPDQDSMDEVIHRMERIGTELDQFIAGIEWSEERILAAIALEIGKSTRDMHRFSKTGEAKHAHSWRKHVQRCANQLRLIDTLFSNLLAGQLDKFNRVAELLGDYNDLTLLLKAIHTSEHANHQQSGAKLGDKAKKQQIRLRELALQSGELIGV
jgi:CHAD domain-containing protein